MKPISNRILSPSEISTFRDCRQAWVYSYVDRLSYKSTGKACITGLIVHSGLATWYERKSLSKCYLAMDSELKKDKYSELTLEEKAEYLGIAKGMFENYIKFYVNDREDYEVLVVESKITEESIGLKCIPDLVVRRISDGAIIIIDHKATTYFDRIDHAKSFDLQKLALFKVLSETYSVNGIMYNYMAIGIPKAPEVLKDGSRLSKKFTPTKCTRELFYNTLKTANLAAGDYPEYCDFYYETPNPFFKRVLVDVTQEEIEDFERTLDIVHKEIAGGVIYKNRRWNCPTSCDFYEMCSEQDKKSPSVLKLVDK